MIFRKLATMLNNYNGYNFKTVELQGSNVYTDLYYPLINTVSGIYYTDKPILIDEFKIAHPDLSIKLLTNSIVAYNRFKNEYDCLFIPLYNLCGISHYYKGFDLYDDPDMFTIFTNANIVTNHMFNIDHLKAYFDLVKAEGLKFYVGDPVHIDSYSIDVSAIANKFQTEYMLDYSNTVQGNGLHALTHNLIILENDLNQENYKYMRYFGDYPLLAKHQWDGVSFFVPTFIYSQHVEQYNMFIANGYLASGIEVGGFMQFEILKGFVDDFELVERSMNGELITNF